MQTNLVALFKGCKEAVPPEPPERPVGRPKLSPRPPTEDEDSVAFCTDHELIYFGQSLHSVRKAQAEAPAVASSPVDQI